MKTLIIDFFSADPSLSLKGLSLKILAGSNIWQRIYRDPEDGKFRIDTVFEIDGKTAKIEKEFLIKILHELRTIIGFDKIKTKNYYPLSGEEILILVDKHKKRAL